MRVFTPKIKVAVGQYAKPSSPKYINPDQIKKGVKEKEDSTDIDVQSYLPGQIYRRGFSGVDIAVINMIDVYGSKLISLENFASRELPKVGDRNKIILFKRPSDKELKELSSAWDLEFLMEHFSEGAETGFVTVAATSEQIIDEILKSINERLSVISARN